jgi:hypothetical protein
MHAGRPNQNAQNAWVVQKKRYKHGDDKPRQASSSVSSIPSPSPKSKIIQIPPRLEARPTLQRLTIPKPWLSPAKLPSSLALHVVLALASP